MGEIMWNRRAVNFVFSLMVFVCAPFATADDSDEAAVKAVGQSLTAAYIARDWDRFASHFTKDAIWLPNDFPPLQGKDAWWSFVEPFWHTSRIVDMDVQTREVVVDGDLAYERHDEMQVVVPAVGEGEEAIFHFKGIWIMQRQPDGHWKIARYIWNFSPAGD